MPKSRSEARPDRANPRQLIFGFAVSLLALCLASGFEEASYDAARAAERAVEPEHFGTLGLDLSGGDPSSRPGDDFFRFVNGRWVDRTPIPSDLPGFGTDILLSRIAEAQLRDLLRDGAAAADPDAAVTGTKLMDFYASFMDEPRIEALDLAPIRSELEKLRLAASHDELAQIMGEANEGFFSSIFSIKIDLDAKIPDRYVVTVSQSGLGLPDRDFYFLSAFAEKKNAYRAYMVRLLRMLDWERPKRRRATSSISKRASQQRAGPSPKSAMRSALTLPRRSTSSRPRPLSRGGARSARRGSAKSSAWS